MSIKEIILERISKDELKKLNILSFNLIMTSVTSIMTIYQRDDAESTFHNSRDLQTGGFYKHSSLLISQASYEKL